VLAEAAATTRLIERTVPVAAPGGNVAPASAPIVPNAAGPASSGLSVAASLTGAGCWAAAAASPGCCCCWLAEEASAGVCVGAEGGGCALQVTLPSLQRARCTVPPTRSPWTFHSTSGDTVTSTSTLFAMIIDSDNQIDLLTNTPMSEGQEVVELTRTRSGPQAQADQSTLQPAPGAAQPPANAAAVVAAGRPTLAPPPPVPWREGFVLGMSSAHGLDPAFCTGVSAEITCSRECAVKHAMAASVRHNPDFLCPKPASSQVPSA